MIFAIVWILEHGRVLHLANPGIAATGDDALDAGRMISPNLGVRCVRRGNRVQVKYLPRVEMRNERYSPRSRGTEPHFPRVELRPRQTCPRPSSPNPGADKAKWMEKGKARADGWFTDDDKIADFHHGAQCRHWANLTHPVLPYFPAGYGTRTPGSSGHRTEAPSLKQLPRLKATHMGSEFRCAENVEGRD